MVRRSQNCAILDKIFCPTSLSTACLSITYFNTFSLLHILTISPYYCILLPFARLDAQQQMMMQPGAAPQMGMQMPQGGTPAGAAPVAGGGNLYTLPQGSLQPQMDNVEYNLRPAGIDNALHFCLEKFHISPYFDNYHHASLLFMCSMVNNFK